MLTSHKGNRGAFSFQINEIMTNAKNGCSGVVTSAKKKKKGSIVHRHGVLGPIDSKSYTAAIDESATNAAVWTPRVNRSRKEDKYSIRAMFG